MDHAQLEIMIYQIVDDTMLKKNRRDGTGWEWGWAELERDWMDATLNRFAYRCLPLSIANQTGWWVKSPVGFTAIWNGLALPGNIDFQFDAAAETWSNWINNQFGQGIITWNTPFLFRTRPAGSRLLICGPINQFKTYAQPLTAVIESDWMSMSFTMNWKVVVAGHPVRFEAGEPLFQAIPLFSNVCADLEMASVTYQRLSSDPDVFRAYQAWNEGRTIFHRQKANGEVKPDDWQKDYFLGRDALGQAPAVVHMTKVKPPRVKYLLDDPVAVTGSSAAHGVPDQVTPAPAPASAPVSRRAQPEPAVAVATSSLPPQVQLRFARRDSMLHSIRRSRPNPRQHPRREPSHIGADTREGARPARSEPKAAEIRTADVKAAEARSSVETSVRVNDEWRRWIAENLILEGTPESLLATMTAAGIAPEEAEREIRLASESPYLHGSEVLRNRLNKRNWQLAVYRKLNRLHPESAQVEHREKLSRDEFLRDYYSTNRLVIITGMMDEWPARKKWNLEFFESHFGDREIEVQMGRTASANYEVDKQKHVRKILFSQFVSMVRTSGQTNDFYLTASNDSSNKKALPELWDDIVQIPEYLDGSDRMAGYLWMGPPGTITPFHHDLTNNFMAQVIGRKRLKIVPSWDIPLMSNHYHVFSSIDGRELPANPRPGFEQPQVLDCVLNAGEILFLPIGCMHFVEGLDVSVTVSFTNFVFDNDFTSFYSTYHAV
ncbi:MAG: cupin-like domain-containing protein [Planctomycetaceae bacterium]|nr:cupin-like domain-containing protein [Planctomycetaceae bacterium]